MANWSRISAATIVSGSPAAPGNVTVGAITYRYTDPVNDGSVDGEGQRTLELFVPYTVPSPLGTFKGVIAYIEYPDQSSGAWFVLDGVSSALDGTDAIAGDWKPEEIGRYPYNAADVVPVAIKGLRVPAEAVTIRVYLASYSESIDNQLIRATEASPTPSTTVAVATPAATVIGEEYCKIVTGFSVQSPPPSVLEGGVMVTHIKCTFTPPDDPRWSGVRIVERSELVGDVVLGLFTSSPTDSWFPTPVASRNVTIFAVSYADQAATSDPDDDSVNTIVGGFTPYQHVTIGTTLGTIDLGQSISASVGAALQVVAGVLGVAPGGITNSLLGTFAVAQANLANAQIIDAARIVDLAVETAKLAAGAVTTPKIALLAVTTAVIDNAAITNAKIANLAVDGAKIANASIVTAHIQNAQITTALIANLAVTNALIASAAITSVKIGDAEVINAKIATLDAAKITTGTLTAINIVGGTLTLNLNGYTTTIDNASYGVGFAGILVRQNSSPNVRSALIGQGLYVSSNTSVDFVELTTAGGSGANGNLYLREWDGSSYTWITRLNSRSIQVTTVGAAGIVFANGNQLIGTRTTGWGTPTGTLTRTSFDPSTATLVQLGERVAALITDIIQGHGFLGA